MPTISLNSQAINYNNIYYVSVNGDDATGDGTKTKPFKSYDKAFSKSLSGDLIYFIKGNYTITALSLCDGGYTGAFLYDQGKQLVIYAEPFTYITINNPTNAYRDSHAINTINSNTKVIGFTIDYYITNRTANYTRSLFGGLDLKGTIYNSHFILRSNTSFSYCNNGTYLICDSCQFDVKVPLEASYTGLTSFKNCALNISKNDLINSGYVDLGNNLFSITFDPAYKIIPSTSNYGIYSGLYKWIGALLLLQDGNNIEIASNSDLVIKGTAPFTKELFSQFGMSDLSLVNKDIISKIQMQKYKIGMYRK